MYLEKREMVLVIIAIALVMVFPSTLLYFSFSEESSILTGAAIGLNVENDHLNYVNNTLNVISGGNSTTNDFRVDGPLIGIQPVVENKSGDGSSSDDGTDIPEIILPNPVNDNLSNESFVDDNNNSAFNESIPVNEPVKKVIEPINNTLPVRNEQVIDNKTLSLVKSDLTTLDLPPPFNSQNFFGIKDQGEEDVERWNLTFTGRGSALDSDENDYAYAVDFDSNNNVFIAGSGSNFTDGEYGDWWIKQFSSDGVENTSWNLTQSLSNWANGDRIFDIALDSSDSLYVAGTHLVNFNEFGTGFDIKKFYSNSSEELTLWNFSFSGPIAGTETAATGIVVDSNDDIIVVGHGYRLVATTESDWWIKKFNSSGYENVSHWNHTYNFGSFTEDRAYDVAIDSNDNVYVVGAIDNGAGWLIKRFHSNGTENVTSWNHSSHSGIAYDVATDSNDNVFVVGHGVDLVDTNSKDDWWVKKYFINGSEDTSQWNLTFDHNNSNERAIAVSLDSKDNVYVGGYATDIVNETSSRDWWLKKFNSTGFEDIVDWNKTYDAGTEGAGDTNGVDDEILGLKVDTFGNLTVVGTGEHIHNGASGGDWWIKRFETSNRKPTISSVILNTTDLTLNTTLVNLTVYVTVSDRDDGENGSTKLIYNWLVNDTAGPGKSIAVLNMPFERVNGSNTSNAYDYSGYGNNGDIANEANNATWYADWGYDGKGAYEFDGIKQYIKVVDSPTLSFTDGSGNDKAFSYSAWIKPNSTTQGSGIIGKAIPNGGDQENLFGLFEGDKLYFAVYGGGGISRKARYDSSASIVAKQWRHVVATYDGSESSDGIALYIDGVRVDDTTDNTGSYTGMDDLTSPVTIGKGQIGSQFYNGTIDDVLIFNRSLTTQQVLDLFNNRTNQISFNETTSGQNWTVDVTPNDGTEDGNVSRSNQLIVLGAAAAADTTAPLITVDNPVNNTKYLNISIPVAFTITDETALDTCWFDIQNGTNVTIANCANFSLNPGRGFFRIQLFANDTSGNENATTTWINFSVNELPIIQSLLINTTDVTLNGTNQNLTANVSVTDLDNISSIKLIYNWLVNDTSGPGKSITILNMPFERINGTNTSNTWDYSGYNNSGGISDEDNNATWNTSGIDGKGAYQFDGVNDFILIGNTSTLLITDNFSVEVWAKPGETYRNPIIEKNVNTNNASLVLVWGSTYQLFFGIKDGPGSSEGASFFAPKNNTWYHVVGTINGTNYGLYINGTLVDSVSRTRLASDAGNVMIGRSNFWDVGGNFFNGTIDELRIYNRSLSRLQVHALYNNRTDLISSDETTSGQNWTIDVTPNDGSEDGNVSRSNQVIILNDFCGTLTADKTLLNDVTSVDTCFTIGAADITLDCNNFEVVYGSGGAGTGIDNSAGHNGVTVKNCNIIKQGISGSTNYGILFGSGGAGALNGIIVNNTIITNGTDTNFGIYISEYSNNTRIENNTINSDGSSSDNTGINVEFSHNLNVEGNKIFTDGTSDNKGIVLTSGSNHSILYNNTIFTNGSDVNNYGIYINLLSSNNTIYKNTIHTYGADSDIGVIMDQRSSNNNLENNTILSNSTTSAPGVWIENSFYNRVYGNTITTNGSTSSYGIYLYNGANHTLVMNNTISTKGYIDINYGVNIEGNVSNVTIVDNVIYTYGTVSNYGVFLVEKANFNRIENNSIYSNGSSDSNDGIQIGNSLNNKIVGNTIVTNGTNSNVGIYLVDGSNHTMIDGNIITARGSTFSNYGAFFFGSHNMNNTLRNNNITVVPSADFIIMDQTLGTISNYLIYNNSHGQIKWEENNSVESFLRNLTINVTNKNGLGFDGNLFLGNNTAALNTSAFFPLRINSSANITLHGIDIEVTRIESTSNFTIDSQLIKDTNNECENHQCNITSFVDGTLKFNISSFSSYVGDVTPSVGGPTCTDGIKNGDEEDVDCGGSCPNSCGGGSSPPAPPAPPAPPVPPPSPPQVAEPAPIPVPSEEESPVTVDPSLSDAQVVSTRVSISNPTGRVVRLRPRLEDVPVDIILENEEEIRETITAFAKKIPEGLCGNDVDGNVELIKLLETEKPQAIYKKKYSEIFEKSSEVILNKFSEGLSVNTMSGMIFGESFVCGNLLRSKLLDDDEIVLQPGEKIEKELKFRRGLSPNARNIKIVFTEAADTFTEKTLDLGEILITGTAIDTSMPGNLFDIYFLVVSEVNGNLDKSNSYLLELTLNKVPKNKFLSLFRWFYDPEVLYSELYGPYDINVGDTNLFAQQIEYDPALYNGNYLINTKVYKEGKIIAEDVFEILLNN